jgi:uncharacterized membrane protein YbaN (DUF454 family)
MKRYLLLVCGWISCTLGCIGVFVPVLPTTPFLLLATFLFAQSSPRIHSWIMSTRVYGNYVLPFKEAGGIDLGTKVRIILTSYVVMGLSAYFVQRWYIWLILTLVALFLLYLMFIRIPTISKKEVLIRRAQQKVE